MKGFSTVMLLFLLPLLLIITTVSVTSFYWISAYTQKQKLCRHTLLSAQKILAEGLNSLTTLNTSAQTLRLKEKLIKMAIAATVSNPALLAKLIRQLQLNHKQQRILNTKMRDLQNSTEIKAQARLIENTKHFLGIPRAKLHLTKSPPQAIAPDFIPQLFFESKQSLLLLWKTQFNSFLNLYVTSQNSMNGSCSTTLIRKGNLWHASLSTK